MACFTIKAHRMFFGRNRIPKPDTDRNTGWRLIVWSRRLIDAEKFATYEDAHAWATAHLPHTAWYVSQTPTDRQDGRAA